jgi:hypothetical protein
VRAAGAAVQQRVNAVRIVCSAQGTKNIKKMYSAVRSEHALDDATGLAGDGPHKDYFPQIPRYFMMERQNKLGTISAH